MESPAVNQVCTRYGVPLLAFKTNSYNESLTASDVLGDHAALPATEIGKRSADLIPRVLDAIPRQSTRIRVRPLSLP